MTAITYNSQRCIFTSVPEVGFEEEVSPHIFSMTHQMILICNREDHQCRSLDNFVCKSNSELGSRMGCLSHLLPKGQVCTY